MTEPRMTAFHEETLADEAATAALARRLAQLARSGDVIALTGDLGAGKTAFARAFINALLDEAGEPIAEEVPSPTFTLVQVYERRPAPVWHFDLYRIEDSGEIWELGFEEALAGGICLIEWPERLGPLLPAESLRLDLEIEETPESASRRRLKLWGPSGWQRRWQAGSGAPAEQAEQ